jgi:protoporphyrinogen/coproporphyrinogen III oxidase
VTVAVIGGGLAGLLTAHELLVRGVDDLVVLERDQDPGGVARTITREGYLLEPGVGSFNLPHPTLSPVFTAIGVRVSPAAAKARFVYTRGRMVRVEPGPGMLLDPLVPVPARLRAMLEPLIPEPAPEGDETLAEFFERRLGRGGGGLAAWLAASGVYAGDPRELSAGSAFPALVAICRQYGSLTRAALAARRSDVERPRMHVPADSMASIADALAAPLGDRFVGGTTVESIRQVGKGWRVEGDVEIGAGAVVLACGPTDAARLMDGRLPSSPSGSHSAPVVVVWLGGPNKNMEIPEGYGVLTGPDTGMVTRGVLFESSYAPHRSGEGRSLVKVIAGGASVRDLVEVPDADVVELVVAETSRILGVDMSPDTTMLVRHHPGIPQYGLGHGDWLADLERLRPGGLHLTGWGYRGVGLAHVATDAARVAQAIAR